METKNLNATLRVFDGNVKPRVVFTGTVEECNSLSKLFEKNTNFRTTIDVETETKNSKDEKLDNAYAIIRDHYASNRDKMIALAYIRKISSQRKEFEEYYASKHGNI